jgi:hypothetical protein
MHTHRVATPIHSVAALLILISACLAGAVSFGLADGATESDVRVTVTVRTA